MKKVWPEFARALWLDKTNTALPSILEADKYDFGLVDIFRWTNQPYSVVKQLPVEMDQRGLPRERFKLLELAETFSETLGSVYEIPPRSFYYEHLKFTDSAVSSVLIFNPVALYSPGDGAKVEVLKKIGGQWSAPEDFTNEIVKTFCRDKRAERIEEMLIIVSNGAGARNALPIRIPAESPMEVSTSNVGCWKWQGTTDYEIAYSNPAQNGSYRALASATFEVAPNSVYAHRASFVSTAGTASSNQVINQAPCVITSVGTAAPIGIRPNGIPDGSLTVNLDLHDSLGSPMNRELVGAVGTTSLSTTVTTVCPGFSQSTTTNIFQSWLAVRQAANIKITADGRTIDAVETIAVPEQFANYTMRLRFNALRE